jgi:hypothetical protein
LTRRLHEMGAICENSTTVEGIHNSEFGLGNTNPKPEDETTLPALVITEKEIRMMKFDPYTPPLKAGK